MKKLLVVFALSVFSFGASAQSLEIEPGLWESTITTTNSMTGALPPQTSTECIVARHSSTPTGLLSPSVFAGASASAARRDLDRASSTK